jgi:magnesium transporter
MAKPVKRRRYANDATESVGLLLKFRLPWLFIGVCLSLCTAVLIANFEDILAADPRLILFIPLIVYMSDSVGTQTATIYIRNLELPQARFRVYLIKELLVGFCLGAVFGLFIGAVAHFWLHSDEVAIVVGLAMWASVTTATVFSLVTTSIINKAGIDPASGVDPIVSVFQDVISLTLYLTIASVVIF